MNALRKRRGIAHRQRGAATLIVVMVLFFITSLVAAYASRNMIFEQRTSANQYRSSQALEAAEAGLEWALTMLNYRSIDPDCELTGAISDTFRDRYLVIDPATRKIEPRTDASGAILTPRCVFNPATSAWSCACPTVGGSPTLAAPTSAVAAPAFALRFVRVAPTPLAPPSHPAVIRVDVVGCTRLSDNCLSFTGQGVVNEGRVVVSSLFSLTGNASSQPLAALTARGAVLVGGSVFNTVPTDSGITVHARDTISSSVTPVTISGSPASNSLIPDDATGLTLPPAAPYSTNDRMFAAFFNMFPETFRLQQAAVRRNCGVAGCTASDLAANDLPIRRGAPIWLTGNLVVDADLGSATQPVLLVVEGNVTFSTAATVYGLVYVRPQAPATGWVPTGAAGTVQGAVVVDGDVGTSSGSNFPTIVYSGTTLNTLRSFTGTFVRVPNSWRDYE